MSAAELRQSDRAHVLLAATIVFDGEAIAVKLRNLSGEGALISGERLPPSGSVVTFQRNDLSVKSRLAWVHADHAGISFSRSLNAEEILQHIPGSERRSIPAVDYRRPGFRPRPLTAEEKAVIEQWAQGGLQQRLGD